uniref:glutathione transferase n=1 Tax=Caenorhabditis japonica TaxID=281687 RepID=A0A8R1I1J4_CAEJA
MTMPQYKLYYFNLRGWAEPARQLFKLAHVEFDDVRMENGTPEWEAFKPTTPFGQVPFLSIDDFKIPQSAAICRYLARKFGYAGKTAEEEAWADAIVDQFKDFVSPLRQFLMAQRAGDATEIERVQKEVFDPARRVFFKIINGILEKSTSGYLVGDGLTWADLVVADNLTTLEKLGVFNLSAEENQKLVAFREKVGAVPEIKEHNATRPEAVI